MKKIVSMLIFLLSLLIFAGYSISIPDLTTDKLSDIILVIDDSASMKNLDRNEIYLFLKNLKNSTRCGIVSFGTNAKLLNSIQPLQVNINNIKNNLYSNVKFDDQHTNINTGLIMASSEFLHNNRKDASKVVILISDGKMSPKSKKINEYLQKKIIPDYVRNNFIIYSITYGDKPDIRFMQDIAKKTNGKCFISTNNEILRNVLSIIVDNMNSVTEYQENQGYIKQLQENIKQLEEKMKFPPKFIVYIILMIVVLTLALTSIFVYVKRKYIESPLPDGESTLSLVGLRENLNEIKEMKSIEEVGLNINNFQKKLTNFSIQLYGREKEATGGYMKIIGNLFLLLDSIEIDIQENGRSSRIEEYYDRARSILKDQGIEEITVNIGDQFDGKYHSEVERRSDESPKNSILEVIRKGYFRASNQKENEGVIRFAEVIVSNGPSTETK